jgi:hypothetical protein
MPSKLVKSFAKRTSKPVDEVEAKWNKAKKAILDNGISESDDSFYPQVVAVLKKMLGLKEQFLFAEKFKQILKDTQ